MIVANQPECPKCHCKDIRRDGFLYICLRCGTTYDQDGLDLDEIIKLSLKRGNRETSQI
jgi:DNA-directed RNA polymerase subunit RPC12/RpoP